jgi:hypothetical protein
MLKSYVEKPAENQTFSISYLALWLNRLTPDQEHKGFESPKEQILVH